MYNMSRFVPWEANMKTVSVAEARAGLSDCIREAEGGESILITRHGKPVAALVAANDLEQLDRLRAAGPQTGLAGLAGGWEGSEDLVQALDEHRRLPARETPELD
jgi:prevent-host-death family protein